jgi:hypothetical protein
MKSKLFVLIIGFALFGGSSLASAAIVTITFSGTIDPVGSPGFYSGTVGGFSPLSFQGANIEWVIFLRQFLRGRDTQRITSKLHRTFRSDDIIHRGN